MTREVGLRVYASALLISAGLLAGCSDETGVVTLRGVLETEPLVDFGAVQVGIEMPYALVLANRGDGALTITTVEAAAGICDRDYEFRVEGACEPATIAERRLTLQPNTERVLQLSFQPYVAMDASVESSLRLLTDALDDEGQPVTLTVTLRGRGVASGMEVVPNPVDFGKVLAGSARTLDVEVFNRLGVPVDITTRLGRDGRPEIVNMGGLGRFEVLEPIADLTRGGSLLAAGAMLGTDESLSVKLRYIPDPSVAGRQDRGRWTISNCESTLCDLEVTLLGEGTNAAIECDPPALDFGQVNPGGVLERRVTCTNAATESVTVLGWSMGLGSSPDYAVTPYSGQVTNVAPGESFEVQVEFAPTQASIGTDPTGTLLIRGRNPVAGRDLDDVRVELVGEAGGPDIRVTPQTLAYGQVAIGTTSKRRVLIENVGYNDLEVSQIQTVGDFVASRRGPLVIAPGASEVVEVDFTPTAVGDVMGELVVTSNDAGEPEVSVALIGQGADLPPCAYTLEPANISFGIVQVLRSTTQGVRIQNIGADICLINDVTIALGSDPDFGLVDGTRTGIQLDPGQIETILVSYTPSSEAVHTGDLSFYISDPGNSTPTVALHGVGAASALLVSPNELDFGQIGVGCSTRERVVSVYNTGSTTTYVERVELPPGVSTEFELSRLPPGVPGPPGAAVAPGESVDIAVRYRSVDVGQDTGFFHVYERGRTDPYVVPLFGSGALDPINEDVFEQLETPEVDILFVIDNSCSMSEEQASLTANFQSFIQFADAQALDYRLAVVSTDMDICPSPASPTRPASMDQGRCGYFADGNGLGTLQNPDWRLITPDEQPSPEDAFAAIGTQGIDGSGTEQGLEAAYRALSSPLITGWNAGFLRPDAYLALIFISDEEDQSPNAVDFYVNSFLAIKGFRNTNLFSASAIVGDAPSGCGGFQADPGLRYIEVANRTGGIFESICTSDWASALQNLGLTVFGYKSRFFLGNQPVPGTVEVFVDGVQVDPTAPSGQIRWSYEAMGNSVNFAPLAIPEPGAQIVVRYRPECL